MSVCLLEMKSVSVAYGNNIVLQDIDLKVYDNDFIGVMVRTEVEKQHCLKLFLDLSNLSKESFSVRSSSITII